MRSFWMNRQGVIFLDRKNKKSFAFSGDLEWSPEADDKKDLLQFALESGMIDLETVRDAMAKKKRKEYLAQHNNRIWHAKNGRWCTYIDTEFGRKAKSRKTKEALEDALVEYYKSQDVNPTFRTVFNAWNDRKLELGKISPATHYRNIGLYKRHFEDFGRRRVGCITEDDIWTFLEEQVPKHNLNSRAFNNLKTAIRGTMRYARRKHYTDISIETVLRDADMTEIRFTHHVKDDSEEVYSEEEADRIIHYLVDNPDEINTCILLLFVTGMRVGEVVTLKHEDLGDTYINVRRTESRYRDPKGKLHRTVKDFPKTLAGWRTIAVPKDFVWVIDKARKLNPFGEWVFPRKNGLWMSTWSVRTRLRIINDELGIVQKSPHKIRKTYGSILLDNNIDMKMVMVQMGHADILTTERSYHRNRRTLDHRQEIISQIPDFKYASKC